VTTAKRQFTLRLQDINFDKISFIAEKNKRSTTMQIEWIIEKYIEEYEKSNGPISMDEHTEIGDIKDH
jgi:hypothetical protein